MLPEPHRPFRESHPNAWRGYVLGSLNGLTKVQGLKVFYSDQFVFPLPEGHRFPMVKYSMLRESRRGKHL
jgi:hypothetical protein